MQFKSLIAAAALLQAITAEYTPSGYSALPASYFLKFAAGEFPGSGTLKVDGLVKSVTYNPVFLESDDDISSSGVTKKSVSTDQTKFSGEWTFEGSDENVIIGVTGHPQKQSAVSSGVNFSGKFILDSDGSEHEFTKVVNLA